MKYKIEDGIEVEGTPVEIAEFIKLFHYKADKEADAPESATVSEESPAPKLSAKEAKREKQREYQRKWAKKHYKERKAKEKADKNKSNRTGMARTPEVEAERRRKIGEAIRAAAIRRRAARAAAASGAPAESPTEQVPMIR